MIEVVVGVLAEAEADAILRPIGADLAPVNAPSRDLAAAAGPELDERLERLGAVPVGGAVITPGGDLPAEFVIHAVVMSAEEPQTALTVQRALRNGLRRAADWDLASLALPPLGIGAGTMDAEESARGLLEILFHHLDEGAQPQAITLVVGSEYEADLFGRLVEELAAERG